MYEPTEGQGQPSRAPGHTEDLHEPRVEERAASRPAEGAAVGRPSDILDEEWSADGNTEDFLGLSDVVETEAENPAEATDDVDPEAGTKSSEEEEFDSWLEDSQDEVEGELSWLMELDDEQDGNLEEEPELVAAGPARSPWPMRALLILVSLGLGVGVSQLHSTYFGTEETASTEVAQGTPTESGGTTTAPEPAAGTDTEANTETSSEADPATTTESDPAATADATAENTETTNTESAAPEPGATGTGGVGETGPEPVTELPGAPEPGTPGTTEGTEKVTHTTTVPVSDLVVVPRVESPLREASAGDLASIWPQNGIPMDAIGGGDRLLTPRVGQVRVILHDGEVFEGRLYAVGQKKVWLQTDLGKMALVSWQVERIEHITPDTHTTGENGDPDLTGLPSVRVRTPGGVFYGHLIAQDEQHVTLITKDGARLTLVNEDLEITSYKRTRVIDASGVEATSEEKAAAEGTTETGAQPE